jgi:hypothetical protein
MYSINKRNVIIKATCTPDYCYTTLSRSDGYTVLGIAVRRFVRSAIGTRTHINRDRQTN